MRRGDCGHQPGRAPGLEELPEQPAGPAAGWGGGERPVEPAGAGGARRVLFTFQSEPDGDSKVWRKGGSLEAAGSGENLAIGEKRKE